MIDTHCHLTYSQLGCQLDAVLERARAAGVVRMVTIGTTAGDSRMAIELCSGRENLRCAIGIHPHHAAEAVAEDLVALEQMNDEPAVVAMGEMGLDYHYDFSPRARQKEVFVQLLELARRQGRPIVIHCREAIDDCMGILKDFSGVSAVFHCFTGTPGEARRILERGYLIGFAGVLTFKKSEQLREVARFVPADRMLLETDSPYLSPEPMRRHKNNEPALVVHTARVLAREKGMTYDEVDRVTTENGKRFYGWE